MRVRAALGCYVPGSEWRGFRQGSHQLVSSPLAVSLSLDVRQDYSYVCRLKKDENFVETHLLQVARDRGSSIARAKGCVASLSIYKGFYDLKENLQ